MELYLMKLQLKSYCKGFHFHQYFHCILHSTLHFTNSSTNLFLHLQFLKSKYSPTSHNLSHSNSQLLVFQINPLSHITLLINSLHSHLHLSSFHLTTAFVFVFVYISGLILHF